MPPNSCLLFSLRKQVVDFGDDGRQLRFLPAFFFTGSTGFSGFGSGTGRSRDFLFHFPGFKGLPGAAVAGVSPCCPGVSTLSSVNSWLSFTAGLRLLPRASGLSFCAFSASCGTSSGPALPALPIAASAGVPLPPASSEISSPASSSAGCGASTEASCGRAARLSSFAAFGQELPFPLFL